MHASMFDGVFEGLAAMFIGCGVLIGIALVGLFFLVRWVVLHLQWVS